MSVQESEAGGGGLHEMDREANMTLKEEALGLDHILEGDASYSVALIVITSRK